MTTGPTDITLINSYRPLLDPEGEPWEAVPNVPEPPPVLPSVESGPAQRWDPPVEPTIVQQIMELREALVKQNAELREELATLRRQVFG